MKALSRIGHPAVPALIAALRGARSAAEREENVYIGSGPSYLRLEEGEISGESYSETEEDLQEELKEIENRANKRELL